MAPLFRLTGSLAHGLGRAAMVLLGVLVLVVSADVGARVLGLRPLAWVPPLAEHILLYATFLPMPALVRTKGHVFVEFIRSSLPAPLQRALELAVYATCVAICGYLAWVAGAQLAEAVRTGAYSTGTYDTPQWLSYLPMLVGFALSTIEWLRYLAGADSLYTLDPMQMDGY